MQMTDKEMHCLSRIIQDTSMQESVKCLYCKYARECREAFEENKDILYVKLMKELEGETGVCLLVNPETKHKDIISGSWITEYPQLLNIFAKMSFEEQRGKLCNLDILKEGDKK